jgi:hypothetical protein
MNSQIQVSHDDLRSRQQALLRRLLASLANEPHVLGLAAGGSYAHGANDAFSDLDLHVYLRDEERTGREAIHQRVSALAPTLSVLYTYDRTGLYLYEDGVRVDLTYEEPSVVAVHFGRLPRTGPGRAILLDPDGALAAARAAALAQPPGHRAHPRHWQEGDPVYVTWFLWMFRQIYGWTKRGAQGGAHARYKLSIAADSIHHVRTALTEMRLWTLNESYNLAAGDPDLAEHLARTTYPRLVPAEMLAATRVLLDVYERICPDYCAKTGVAYPADKVAALQRVLDDFDVLH